MKIKKDGEGQKDLNARALQSSWNEWDEENKKLLNVMLYDTTEVENI